MSQTDPTTAESLWPCFQAQIVAHLSADDDPGLWQVALETVIQDADNACRDYTGKARIIGQIGCCSHWLAPNKARWITNDGEFTWPSGYRGKAGFFGGLPEFDWCLSWIRDVKTGGWRHAPASHAKRPLVLRVAIPARTGLHIRASIHAMWAPGPRADLNLTRLFYGFRKLDSEWKFRAYRGPSGYRARTKQ